MPIDQHLILHLKEMYSTERDYCDYLKEKTNQVRHPQLKSAVNDEVEEIGRQLDNLRQALNTFGVFPDEELKSPAVEALWLEDKQTMQALPNMNPMDMDAHLAITDISFGHSEIGKYQGMLNLAKVLNRNDVVNLLQDNLNSEQQDLEKMQHILSEIINQEWQEQQRAA